MVMLHFPLRYLIGADEDIRGTIGTVAVVPYDSAPADYGISVGYCNLFDEKNSGKFSPYLDESDTAKEYDEGQIDPKGAGWKKNLSEQFARRRHQRFEYVELDNPDAYEIDDIIGAVEFADSYGLKVIAKNPMLFETEYARRKYLRHPNIHGAIVERDAGDPEGMARLRSDVGKPDLPVWFISFGRGKAWADHVVKTAKNFPNMGVTYSAHGEYGSSVDLLRPREKQ